MPAADLCVSERPVDPRQALGRSGERAAEALLGRAGLRVVARRFRLRCGEIDLVAERGDLTVFVEVKTRSGQRYGRPAEAVTPAKQRRLARAALVFLARSGRLARRTRFDVVEVRVEADGTIRPRHIVDAFRPEHDP
jgi:putative endonuclease